METNKGNALEAIENWKTDKLIESDKLVNIKYRAKQELRELERQTEEQKRKIANIEKMQLLNTQKYEAFDQLQEMLGRARIDGYL